MVAYDNFSLPPERRKIGMVFQDAALFPHLTVDGNIRYGLKHKSIIKNPQYNLLYRFRDWVKNNWSNRPLRRLSKESRTAIDSALTLVGMRSMGNRYPHELSGGEAQRVALARAMIANPHVILLDEPFSNLDARTRENIRTEIRKILKLAGTSAIFVTHDQEEAFSLADHVAVMLNGKIEQLASPQNLYESPINRPVAEFIGEANFIRGSLHGNEVYTEIGPIEVRADVLEKNSFSGEVDVLLRPESLRIKRENPHPPLIKKESATIIDRKYYGNDQIITIELPSLTKIRARCGTSEIYRLGEKVSIQADGPVNIFHSSLSNL